jgi:hypothetical protein
VRPDGVSLVHDYGLWNPRQIQVLNRDVTLPLKDEEQVEEVEEEKQAPDGGKLDAVRAVADCGERYGWEAVTAVLDLVANLGAERTRKIVDFMRE